MSRPPEDRPMENKLGESSEQGNDIAVSPPTKTTHHLLYINCPPSRLFRSHWSIFLPSTEGSEDTKYRGRRIHVTGDVRSGFETRFVRNADLDNGLTGKPRIVPVAWIAKEFCTLDGVDNKVDEGSVSPKEEYEDTNPRGLLENWCMQIPAPGPSLRSVKVADGDSDLKTGSSRDTIESEKGKLVRKELKDCQWWIRRVLTSLEKEGRISPLEGDENVMQRLDQIPQH